MSKLELVTDRYRSNKRNNVVAPKRDIIAAVEDDKVFARQNPEKFARDLSVLMASLDAVGY